MHTISRLGDCSMHRASKIVEFVLFVGAMIMSNLEGCCLPSLAEM